LNLLQCLHLGSCTYGNTDVQDICAAMKHQFRIKIFCRKVLKHDVWEYCVLRRIVVTARVFVHLCDY